MQLQEKTRLLAEMEGEGSSLCRRVQELLQSEEGQRERVSQLSAALDSERKERQALQERLEESNALLSAKKAQLRQSQQVLPVSQLLFPFSVSAVQVPAPRTDCGPTNDTFCLLLSSCNPPGRGGCHLLSRSVLRAPVHRRGCLLPRHRGKEALCCAFHTMV